MDYRSPFGDLSTSNDRWSDSDIDEDVDADPNNLVQRNPSVGTRGDTATAILSPQSQETYDSASLLGPIANSTAIGVISTATRINTNTNNYATTNTAASNTNHNNSNNITNKHKNARQGRRNNTTANKRSDINDTNTDIVLNSSPLPPPTQLKRTETLWITRQVRSIERDYCIEKNCILGQPGQFGVAYRCYRVPTPFEATKSDWKPTYRCVKEINKSRLFLDTVANNQSNIYKALSREIGVLKSCDHANIVHLFDVYETRHKIYLIMEYLDGGELFERICDENFNFTETNVANIMHQILLALNYLHERGIMHLDLKPENILFENKNDDTIKLIDFGLSRVAPRFAKLREKKIGTV